MCKQPLKATTQKETEDLDTAGYHFLTPLLPQHAECVKNDSNISLLHQRSKRSLLQCW